MNMPATCGPTAIRNLLPTDGLIIDVRTAMEHDERRLTCKHLHIPLDQLDPLSLISTKQATPDTPIYLLCRSGGRATQAAGKFLSAGFSKVTVITGGIIACELEGHALAGPSTNAQPLMSLERQVRVAAGAFGALGSALALLVNPWFAVLPLLVGGGLIFAGITDRCGLALMLIHAPWNKKSSPCSCSTAS